MTVSPAPTEALADEPEFSIVVPCFNEAAAIERTLEEIGRALADAPPHEIIFVDDGSNDGSGALLDRIAATHSRLRVIHHPVNRGYGAALKTGIRQARGEYIAITDADGTYPNQRLAELVALCRGRDMVVGARIGQDVSYSRLRALPKFFLKRWVSYLARRPVPDINSGMRVFRKDVSERFFGILPDGFSFTITITLATITNFLDVLFVPIGYAPRTGRSHIKPIRDTARFIKIILRTGVYFAPVRAFFPVFAGLLGAAVASFVYDAALLSNLTDKTVMLFLFAINIGMFILIADMIDKRIGNR